MPHTLCFILKDPKKGARKKDASLPPHIAPPSCDPFKPKGLQKDQTIGRWVATPYVCFFLF